MQKFTGEAVRTVEQEQLVIMNATAQQATMKGMFPETSWEGRNPAHGFLVGHQNQALRSSDQPAGATRLVGLHTI